MAAVDGMEEALKAEQQKVEALRKIVSLQNGNAKSVQIWNVHQAIDWFKQKEGDTGSPEVQGNACVMCCCQVCRYMFLLTCLIYSCCVNRPHSQLELSFESTSQRQAQLQAIT